MAFRLNEKGKRMKKKEEKANEKEETMGKRRPTYPPMFWVWQLKPPFFPKNS
jgi:hypothetical protein